MAEKDRSLLEEAVEDTAKEVYGSVGDAVSLITEFITGSSSSNSSSKDD